MSFIEELKRRNVFRVGIAYLVVAWLVMQVADVVINNIGAPDWLFETILLVLGIGFPIVLVFAWAFEMTPEGIKKEKDVDRSRSITPTTGRKLDRMIIGVLVVVVAYLLVDKLILQDHPVPEPSEAATSEVKAPVETGPSVAVLPFVNMSGDKENEYFSDGLTETLLHMLAQLPDLRVAARTSSFAFKGQNKSVSEIAATLGVAHILEGSVQKSGERVRITAQLIRADDGFHLWSQNYTRPLEDIFAIQDEIASDVASALDSSLLGNAKPDLKGLATADLKAYDDYLKGLEQQAIFSYGSLNIAEGHFKQSLARDPEFTDARLALVRNYLLKQQTGVINNEELSKLAVPLIEQVRETDSQNRLARAFELFIALTSGNLELGQAGVSEIVTELRNMLPLIPDEALIRLTVAFTLNDFLKQETDAVEVLQAGLLIDPLSDRLHSAMGRIHQAHDRLEEALASFQRAQELNPESPNHYGNLSSLEAENNNLAASLNWLRISSEVDPQDHELAAMIANKLYELELPEEGDRWAARVHALVPGSAAAKSVELNRYIARSEIEPALKLSALMVADQVDMRGGFGGALNIYTDLMMQNNKAREAWDFLVAIRPEISNYDVLPGDRQAAFMQFESVMLITGFESFDKRKEAWLKVSGNLDAMGFPWREPGSENILIDHVMLGETEQAIEYFLDDRLSQPMATNLGRHKRNSQQFYRSLYNEPNVAARLSELDQEFAHLQTEIRELMLEPEWNQ